MFRKRGLLVFLGCGVFHFLAGAGLLVAFLLTGAKPGQLSWDPPTIRKSVISLRYKVYANNQGGEGRYFLSKLALKNTGGEGDPGPDSELPGP
jgi:hypothetical protein